MSHGIGGALGDGLGALQDDLWDAAKLGAGGTIAIMGTDLLLSRVLVSNGAPLVPVKYSPLAIAALSFVGGSFARRQLPSKWSEVGTGIIAGGVSVAVSSLVGTVLAPQTATAGFGFGRALRGLGNYSVGARPQVPPMSAVAGLGSGATLQFEEKSGLGTTSAPIQIEEPSAFSAFN